VSMPHSGESHITIKGIYKRFFLPQTLNATFNIQRKIPKEKPQEYWNSRSAD